MSELRIFPLTVRFIISLTVILLDKSGVTDFQTILLSVLSFGSKFEKYFFLAFHKRVTHKLALFGIANEHSCFKIQFSVCTDKFEQYFDTFHLITMNDLQNFVNNSKSVHPFKK